MIALAESSLHFSCANPETTGLLFATGITVYDKYDHAAALWSRDTPERYALGTLIFRSQVFEKRIVS